MHQTFHHSQSIAKTANPDPHRNQVASSYYVRNPHLPKQQPPIQVKNLHVNLTTSNATSHAFEIKPTFLSHQIHTFTDHVPLPGSLSKIGWRADSVYDAVLGMLIWS